MTRSAVDAGRPTLAPIGVRVARYAPVPESARLPSGDPTIHVVDPGYFELMRLRVIRQITAAGCRKVDKLSNINTLILNTLTIFPKNFG